MMMKKFLKKSGLIFSFLLLSLIVRADEGMWLPQLLGKLNESRMKSLGMKISAADIYSINKGSLKDAIVSFGGFCTGEIISNSGLVLTNHHCGFDAIQNHTTLENNYIRDGFWAKDFSQELPNKGLFATFIVRIEDVTNQAMQGVTKNMTEAQRQSQVDKNLDAVRKSTVKESYQNVFTRGFFEANQYYLFVTETYNDVRLVGAPPSSIGNYGKDTDNWSWPRHTGDFSMFIIYSDKNNKPANYSIENVPLKPKKSLTISIKGIKENDFTMVFGFPGRTNEYLPSEAVKQIVEFSDPIKIDIRDKSLKVIDSFMRSDESIKIKYAAKYATIANAWKKWQGEVLGLNRTDGVGKKIKYEQLFQSRVNANSLWKANYGNVLSDLNNAYKSNLNYFNARDKYTEIVGKIELYRIAILLNNVADKFEKSGEEEYRKSANSAKLTLEDILKDYDVNVDKYVFRALINTYLDQNEQFVSPELKKWLAMDDGNTNATINKIYSQTDLYNLDKLKTILDMKGEDASKAIRAFDAVNLFRDFSKTYQINVQKPMNEKQDEINNLQRTYMQAQLDVMKDRKFYPDANSTLRVTFGQVKGYYPKDGVYYGYQTYLDGVLEKFVPSDYEFDLPQKLIELYNKKDYGKYGVNGKMPVCFIATNHTTGGNSGSPALDAYGNLIGLNFDRVWEGTMSDINYDPSICRNIMVDIRYVLFIVDKFAGATRLIDEMKIVGK